MTEKELFAVVFSCDKFRSYIMDSRVKVHTDRDGLKEILERTDVKPRMIRWILLLQEFELQIVQRKEEPKELKKVKEKELGISTIYVPTGTINHENKSPCSLFNCFSFIVHQVIHILKKKNVTRVGGD